MAAHAITIGPQFFAKAKNDYSNWRWAIAREFAQNCLDAPGTKTVTITVALNADGDTTLAVANDGEPMTTDILINKFLSLGSSGKDFKGTTGGFGKAKEVLCLCHKNYEIVTGANVVTGSGGSYDLADGPFLYGTRTTVTVHGDEVLALLKAFKSFAILSQWSGTFTINGEVIADRLNKGKGRRDLEHDGTVFGRVYTNHSHSNLVVVRINGMPMFTRHTSYDGCVVLELAGTSANVLASNRDALLYYYASELDQFVEDLTVNKRKALKPEPRTERVRYDGYKLAGKMTPKKTPREEGDVYVKANKVVAGGVEYDADSPQGKVAVALAGLIGSTPGRGPTRAVADRADDDTEDEQTVTVPLRPEFTLLNETGLKTPTWFTPDGFSTYSKMLVWRWMGCLVVLADLFETTKTFSVGFCLSEDAIGLCESDGDGSIIYINPAEVSRQSGKSPVLKCRWKLTGDAIWEFISVAAHEFTHHLVGEGNGHDETYAVKLTAVMAKCLASRQAFAKVFQTRVEWPDSTLVG